MDLKLTETGSGGDLIFNGFDLETIDGFENMPYLGMYGGNIEQNTKEFAEGEQRFDYWTNTLLTDRNLAIQMNSDTERLLNNTALNSAARINIEETVKSDLSSMKDFSEIEVFASIEDVDRLKIFIKITRPDGEQQQEFVYIWDATKNELLNG